MKAYGVYSGCIYEGGGVNAIYANRDRAIKECRLMVRRLQSEHAEQFKHSDKSEGDIYYFNHYKWKKKSKYGAAYWDNTVSCVCLQEFDIIE